MAWKVNKGDSEHSQSKIGGMHELPLAYVALLKGKSLCIQELILIKVSGGRAAKWACLLI